MTPRMTLNGAVVLALVVLTFTTRAIAEDYNEVKAALNSPRLLDAASTKCPKTLSDWKQWRDKSIARLLTPRIVNGNEVLDPQQIIADSVALANFIDDCAGTIPAGSDLERLLKNFAAFTAMLRNNLSIPEYNHQFGYTINDFEYLERVQDNIELPALLRSDRFLRQLSDRTTYKSAFDIITAHNATLPADKQWQILLYKSRFLSTPDESNTFGRFFVLVPEDNYDKWIQFGIKTPGDTTGTPINNLSIVSVSRPDSQGRRFNAVVDWWRSYESGSSVKLKARRESQGVTENCIMCHKTSPLGIHPEEEYVFDGGGNLVVNSTDPGTIPQKLNNLIATYGPPFFDGLADPTLYGPALGPAITRTDESIKEWAGDSSLTDSSIRNVKAAMKCSMCHSEYAVGLLNWPAATRRLKSNGNQIYQYITKGWMPPGNTLTTAERAALYECLMKEYYDSDKGTGLFVDWLRNEHQSKVVELAEMRLSEGSGSQDFNTHCGACHSRVAGVNGYGPSLFGVVGRTAGKLPAYRFSSSYVEAGDAGLVWTEGKLSEFLVDPVAFLTAATGHSAVTRMRGTYPDETLRNSIISFLATLHD